MAYFVSASGTTINTSVDGAVWVQQSSSAVSSVVWAQSLGIWAGVGDDGVSATSRDGITWTESTIDSAYKFLDIAWAPQLNLFAAVAHHHTPTLTPAIFTSADGVSWVQQTCPFSQTIFSVIWVPELGLFVATGGSTRGNPLFSGDPTPVAQIAVSHNGISWTFGGVGLPTHTTYINNPGDPSDGAFSSEVGSVNCVAWSPGLRLMVCGANPFDHYICTSPDGITWTIQFSLPDSGSSFLAAAWSSRLNKFFIAVGNPFSIAASTDENVVAANGLSSGTIYVSSDGLTWTTTPLLDGKSWTIDGTNFTPGVGSSQSFSGRMYWGGPGGAGFGVPGDTVDTIFPGHAGSGGSTGGGANGGGGIGNGGNGGTGGVPTNPRPVDGIQNGPQAGRGKIPVLSGSSGKIFGVAGPESAAKLYHRHPGTSTLA